MSTSRGYSRKIRLGYGVAAVILVAVTFMSQYNTVEFIQAATLRKQSSDSLHAMAELLSTVKDAETGQRGYLLTGDNAYLGPYHDAVVRVPVQLAAIRGAAEATPLGARKFGALTREIDQKFEELGQTIQLRQNQGPEAALAVVRSNQGKEAMDRIRDGIAELEQLQTQIIEEHDQALESTTRSTSLIFAFGLLIALCISLASVVVSNRDAARRKKHEDELSRFRAAMDVSADAIYVVDRSSMKLIDVNETACAELGYSKTEILDVPLARIFNGASPGDLERDYDETIARAPHAVQVKSVCVRKDGSRFPVEILRRALLLDEGPMIVGIARDVSEREQSERFREEANRKLEQTLAYVEERNRDISLLGQMTSVLHSCLTVDETYEPTAKYCELLFPNASGALYLMNNSGNFMEEVMGFGGWRPQEPVLVLEDCWALRRGQTYEVLDPGSGILCKHVGHPPATLHSYRCIPMTAHHEIIGLFHLQIHDSESGDKESLERLEAKRQIAAAMVEQVTLSIANLKLREALRQQSMRDPLSGLYNRRFLEEFLEREFARTKRRNTPLAIMIVDVDHFKRFNDTFGHEAGDIVLRNLARFMLTRVRDNDVVSRMGGEEFAVVMPEATIEVAWQRAEQLRDGAQSLDLKAGTQVLGPLSISIGLAAFPEHGQDIKTIIAAADRALYQAKNAGRNRTVIAETLPAPQELKAS